MSDERSVTIIEFVDSMPIVQRQRLLLAMSYFSVLHSRHHHPDIDAIGDITDQLAQQGADEVTTLAWQSLVYAAPQMPKAITEDLSKSPARQILFPLLSDDDITTFTDVLEKTWGPMEDNAVVKADSTLTLSREDFVYRNTAAVLTQCAMRIGMPWFSTIGQLDAKEMLLRNVASKVQAQLPGSNGPDVLLA